MASFSALSLLPVGGLVLGPAVHGQTTIASMATIATDHRHAYAANFGWIDARAGDGGHGAVVGEFVCSGHLWSANTGWISLGDGSPTNGVRYANTAGQDSGVNHVGDGRLRGLAWSANLGWIVFEDTGNPRVDLDTGRLGGFAWVPNAGWIHLDSVVVTHVPAGADSDADSIPDAWEWSHTPDLATLGAGDADCDGLDDAEEYAADTDPLDPDSRLLILSLEPQAVLGSTRLAWTSQPTRRYQIFSTENLVDWEPAPDAWIVPSDGTSTVAVSAHPDSSRRFFKIKASRPLASP